MAVDRSRMPAVGPDPAFAFPAVRKTVLPSGLDVWTVEHRKMPVVSALLLLPGGSAGDPDGLAGLASLTASLLDEGCGSRSGLEIHEWLGRLGALYDVDVGLDATTVRLKTLSRTAADGLALLAELVSRPTFVVDAFERLRKLRLDRLAQLREVAPVVADRAFAHVLYGDQPYGCLSLGTETAMRALARADVANWHAQWYRPSLATLVVAGGATHEELVRITHSAFGGWSGASSDDAITPVETPPPAPRLVVIDRPGAAQSELRIGHVAVPRGTADYFPLLVLNMVLGGQFTSRINLNLREGKGYTYGVRSHFDFRRRPGPFVVQTSVATAATVDSVREVFGEIRAVRGDRPVVPAELDRAAAGLTRAYPRGFETSGQVASGLAQVALHSLPDDHFSQFGARVGAVGAADLARVAWLHLDPERLSTVIVGDRAAIADGLDDLGLGPPAEIDVP